AVSMSTDTLLRQAFMDCGVTLEAPDERPGNEDLSQRLGGSAPAEMMAAPLWVRNRVAAILYADAGEDGGTWCPEAVSIMTTLAALGLESLSARAKAPRPSASSVIDILSARGAGEAGTAAAPEPPAPETEPLGEEEPDGEARRFARLLVSEILLYNERQVEEGRRDKDLYERLKEDIERSHLMYQQRISRNLANPRDYFSEELIKTLAGGDASALKLPWG
ncbi:MAG TPA: hypothetical protein VFG76_01595, partial [Candidatus Polarisedimenticolia bacterium]|nr:hypothetical protein [Candidatus Polarisedimenticolia bacterium]